MNAFKFVFVFVAAVAVVPACVEQEEQDVQDESETEPEFGTVEQGIVGCGGLAYDCDRAGSFEVEHIYSTVNERWVTIGTCSWPDGGESSCIERGWHEY